MQWLRSRVRLGSWLALFALVLQLALTFGHVHVDGLPGGTSTRIEASAGAPAPTGNDGPNAAGDYCALCALLHLAGTLVPVAITLLLPVIFTQSRPPDAGLCFALPARRSASFAARAPPLA
jgi:hypothetical protein